jgi:ATPase subunit of ABC transporter with duplicated ATPase domains
LVNRLATQIWELRDGALQVVKGDYQAYLEQRPAGRKTSVAERQAAAAK